MTGLPNTTLPARPFLDWPVVTDPAGWAGAPVVLLGIPQSEPYPKDSHPNDQSRAPDAIRLQSGQFCDGPDHWDFDLGAELGTILPAGCLDGGNIAWAGGPYDDHAARVGGLIAGLWRGGTQVLVLGGDHGVTIPVLDALQAVGEPVHVVQIDAHLDWREDVQGVTRGYSSPMRWASRLPWIAGMTQIGLRGTGSARRAEVEAARAWGSHLLTAADWRGQGLGAVLAAIPADRTLYITIDADGLDPSDMPGVMGPVPGGPRLAEVADLLRALARRQPVAGLDLVEVAPGFDTTGHITCIGAGRLILTLLGAAWAPRSV